MSLNMGTVAVLTLAMLLLSGCVGFIPVPDRSTPSTGTILERNDTRFIARGTTSWSDVTNRLGSGFRASCRMPAYAYSWEKPGGTGVWWFVVMYGGKEGEVEWSHWRAFFVLCDEKGTVVNTKFVRLKSGRSMDEQIEKWALRHARR